MIRAYIIIIIIIIRIIRIIIIIRSRYSGRSPTRYSGIT